MGWNDHYLEDVEMEELCPYCGGMFVCTYVEQTPGFRMMDTKTCPHCGKVLDRSMTFEYYVRKA